MGIIGFIVSLVSLGFMLIGLIPFLGWLNWVTTLPLAVIGAVISVLGLTRYKSNLGITGLFISVIVIFIAISRLSLGCGII